MKANTLLLAERVCAMACATETDRSAILRVFRDTIAVMLAGAGQPAVTAVRRAVSLMSPSSKATGMEERLAGSPEMTALVLGTASHALDFDDVAMPPLSHPSAVLVPAILCLAADHGLDGRACFDAYLAGFEVMCRLGQGVNPQHYANGWHTTLSIGVIGAAAACARLLALTPRECAMAMGIVGSIAGGSKKHFGTQLKQAHAGLGAMQGILAAKLASAGLTADDDILMGRWGFAEQMTGSDAQLGNVLQSLPETSALAQFGVWCKRYPCCASAHRPMDALATLTDGSTRISSANPITRIRVTMPAHSLANLAYQFPASSAQARFCLDYCLFLVLRQQPIDMSSFDLTSETIASFERFSREVSIEANAWPNGASCRNPSEHQDPWRESAEVEVCCADGTSHVAELAYPSGHPQNPLSDSLVWEKFADCAGTCLDYESVRSLYEGLADIASPTYAQDILNLAGKGSRFHFMGSRTSGVSPLL